LEDDSVNDSCSDLTIFIIATTGNPNYSECIRGIRSQTAVDKGAGIVEIRDVAPMSAAFQQMIEQCRTRFYVQIDCDMVMEPDATEAMLEFMRTQQDKTAFAVFLLHDPHVGMDIQGVKIYDHAIMAKYPYNLDIISCEKEQLERLRADGYRIAEERIVMGVHSPHWTPELIFERYFDLMEKWKVYGYSWLEDLPAKLLRKYLGDQSEVNLYAFLGAWASASRPERLRTREKDYRVRTREFLIAQSWFKQPTQATLYMTSTCNLKCHACLRQGDMAHVSIAPDATPQNVIEIKQRFPTVTAICLCGFGETLLHPNIGAIIDKCKALNLHTNLITNGVLLEEAWDTLLEHRPSCLSISLNASSAEEHDTECGVPGTWDKVMRGFERIASHQRWLRNLRSTDIGIQIFLSRICHADNLATIPEFLDFVAALPIETCGIDLHNILPHDVGTPEKEQAFLAKVLTVKYQEQINALMRHRYAYLVRNWPILIDQDKPQRRCQFAFKAIAVDGNLNYSICNSVFPPQPENGEIRDPKVWRSDYAQGLRLSFAENEIPAWCKWCFRNWQ